MIATRVGMAPTLTVAAISLESKMADVEANLKKAIDVIAQAAARGAEIVVFPETYLTGYTCAEVEGKFFELAEPIPGPATEILVDQAKKHNIYVAMGLVEADQGYNGVIHNSAVFLGPEGILHVHRKVHLPEYAPCLKEIHYGIDDCRIGFKLRRESFIRKGNNKIRCSAGPRGHYRRPADGQDWQYQD